nr:DNA-binding protein [uncultured Catonella sp.]
MEKKADILDERLRISELFDYYGVLLKKGQSKLLEAYILEDLSLSEIADIEGISRQGVHDNLKRSIKQLEEFDNKLELIKKSKEISGIAYILKETINACKDEKLKENIRIDIVKLENIF